MIEFPVNYKFHELALGGGYNLRNVYNTLARNISGNITEVVIPANSFEDIEGQGHSSGAPCMNQGTWFYFDPVRKSYLPVKVFSGSVIVRSEPTANRVQYLQDEHGKIALLDEVYGNNPTVILPEGTTMVDWDTGINFKCTLSKDRPTYFHMAHSRAGMEIDLLVVNAGGNYAPIWDTVIKWPASTPPVMPTSKTGSAKSMLVKLRNLNGDIYGESLATSEHAPILPEETLTYRVTGTTQSPKLPPA